MKKCIRFVSMILLFAFVITVKNPVDIHAAVVNTCFPYTLGERVEYAYTSMTEYHSFEVTKRSKVKVEISIPQEQEYKYSGSVSFYFERKADGDIEDVADSKYYDYDEKITVERGANVDKEITLQPGKYYFVESQGSVYKFTYQFKISVLEQEDTPTYSGITKNGNRYDVAYKIGTEFKAHNYQYERSTMCFYFTVPYRTQYDLSVGIKKDEYVTAYTYTHYDTVKIQRDNNSQYTPYADVNSYVVKPGESIQKAVTLEAGKYRIEMKSNDGLRGDFSLKLSVGSVVATSIKFDKPTVTIERGQATSVSATATPLNGTAIIRYQSSNTKVATVSATGWVTGIKEGTATLTAYLQNGKKATCTIKIKEMKALAEVVDQRSFYAYHNKNEVLLDFTPYKDGYIDISALSYESDLDIYKVKRTFKVYRSTKKNGKYKYIGQVSYKKSPGYAEFVDKKVKAIL